MKFAHYVMALTRAVLLMVGTIIGGDLAATTLLSVNLAQLSETAEKAFVIRIDSVVSTTTATGSYDLVEGVVVEPVFGDVESSETISWKQYRVSKALSLAGMPTYVPGKEYLVFLSGKGRGTEFQMPVGMAQGAFDVYRRKSGEMAVRNGFMNSTLTAGLNTATVAQDVVARSSRTRGLSQGAKQNEARQLQRQLKPQPSGNSFRAIKEAAQFFREEKMRGRQPARDYLTTTPARLLH